MFNLFIFDFDCVVFELFQGNLTNRSTRGTVESRLDGTSFIVYIIWVVELKYNYKHVLVGLFAVVYC